MTNETDHPIPCDGGSTMPSDAIRNLSPGSGLDVTDRVHVWRFPAFLIATKAAQRGYLVTFSRETLPDGERVPESYLGEDGRWHAGNPLVRLKLHPDDPPKCVFHDVDLLLDRLQVALLEMGAEGGREQTSPPDKAD